MMDNRLAKSARAFRLAGRIIGLIVAVFILIFLIGESTSDIAGEGWETITASGILLGVLMLTALAGCILSWWKEKLAMALLLLVSIGLGIHIAFSAGRNHFLAWLMVGLPFLITAALLATGWWLERKGEIEKGGSNGS